MDLASSFTHSMWAALFAVGLGVRLTAPLQYLVPTFLGGFAGKLVHSLLVHEGMSRDWATVLAAAAIVAVAVATTRRHRVSPIVLICAVLPLGAAGAVFRAVFELLRVSSADGEAVNAAALGWIAYASRAFTGTMAIALGLGVGMTVMRLLERREELEGF
jgi:uncharacterized membrane protein YjjB (DUF3815 family)